MHAASFRPAVAAPRRRWAESLLDLAREIGGSDLVARLIPLPDSTRIDEIRRAAGVDSSPRTATVDARGVVVSLRRC